MGSDFPLANKFLKIGSDLGKFINIVRREGISHGMTVVKATVFYRLCAWEGARFDAAHHVETAQPVHLDNLTTSSEDVIGYPYVGTSPWVLRTAIDLLPSRLDEFVFVDIGCGKGRVVLVAAERKFKKVIGIDIAEELLDVARENVKHFQEHCANTTQIEIIKSDATKFAWPLENCVLQYFAAPLNDKGVLNMVLQNAYRSYSENPREMYLIVVNDHGEHMLEKVPFLKSVSSQPSVSAWICKTLFSLNIYKFVQASGSMLVADRTI